MGVHSLDIYIYIEICLNVCLLFLLQASKKSNGEEEKM